jgi:hypothetical protein
MNNWYNVGVPMGLASTNDPRVLAKQVAEHTALMAGDPDYQYSYATEDGNTFGNIVGTCGMPHDYEDDVLNDFVRTTEFVIQRL